MAMKEPESFTCCLCGNKIFGEWPNNPQPLVEKGECCDECNLKKVIPARLARVKLF